MPVIWNPRTTEAGIRLNEPLIAIKSAYTGAGTQREVRWQLSATSAFPASSTNVRWDSLLRENNDNQLGDDWVEIPVPLLTLTAGGTYYLSCLVRNTSSESSSWATAIEIAFESAPLTSTTFREAA